MKILYVEDEFAHVELIQRTLEERIGINFALYHRESIQGTLEFLESEPDVDLILTDLRLPDGSGLNLLKKVREHTSPPAVVLLIEQGDQEAAVVALKAGAADYIVKQSDYLHRLPVIISNAVAQNQLLREQAALREAEVRYQSLVEQIPAVVFLDAADESETTLYISPRILDLTGYTPDEWRADPDIWMRGIHPEDRDRIAEADRRAALERHSFQAEYRFTRRDGRIIWIKEDTNLIRNKDGDPLYWQGILLDITQERESQAAIRESEERFRRIFHATPIATCVVTLDEGRFIDANQAYLDLTGNSLDTLIGRTSVELGYWERPQDREEFVQRIKEERSLQGINVQYTNVPEGPKDTVAYYELIELGGSSCVLAMFYEVTEQKKAQAALQAERDFALQVLNNMGQGLTVTNQEGRFEYINPAYAAMLGYAPEELAGKRALDLASHSEQSALEEEGKHMQRGHASMYESKLLHKDGREVPTMITGAIAVITDLTALKKAEEALARQVKELTVLHAVTVAGTEGDNEDEIIESVVRITTHIYDEVCGVLLLNERGDILRPHPSYFGANAPSWQDATPITQGITGKAVSMGKAIRLGNLTQDPAYIEIAAGVQSELCVPIRVNRRIIGVLNVESRKPEAFDEEDEQFLHTVAGSLGTALERLRLFKEEQRRLRELETIDHLSASLRAAQLVDDMLPILLDETMKLNNTRNGSIWLYDHSSDLLVRHLARGTEAVLKQTSLKPNEGIVGHTFTTGKKYTSMDLMKDALLFEGNRESIAPGIRGLFIPIQSTAGPVGVLTISTDASHPSLEGEYLLPILAEITGNAIHRAELFEQSQDQVRRLTALRDIDSAIASSTDLRVTLNILTDHALKHLKADAVDILLYHPELQSLTHLCSAGYSTPSPSRPFMRIGEGLAGKIVMQGRTGHVTDLQNSGEVKRDPLLAREGFVTYIGVPLIVKGQIKGVFEVFQRSALSPNAEWMQFLQTLAGEAAIAIDNNQLFDHLQRSNQEITQAYDTTLEGWARALELRDRETEGHARRVTEMTLRLSQRMGLGENELIHIYRGVLLHDIGKMGVPDQILKKTGTLTEAEWIEMRRHPQYAFDLLSPIPYLRPALDIPYCHHEHWDGSGYPRRLKAEQIPLAARIFSVVDIYDALLSNRPYRKAWPRQKAIQYVKSISGKILDPKIVNTFMEMLAEDEHKTG